MLSTVNSYGSCYEGLKVDSPPEGVQIASPPMIFYFFYELKASQIDRPIALALAIALSILSRYCRK